MARTKLRTARKTYTCGRCGKTISPGESYQSAKPGFRSRTKLIRCTSCGFRASELTTSKMSGAYAAIEDAQEALRGANSVEDIESILSDARDSLEGIADEYRDASSNWAGGYNEAMEEKASIVDDAISEIDGWQPDGEPEPCQKEDHDEQNQEGCEECDEIRAAWVRDQIDSADDMLAGIAL